MTKETKEIIQYSTSVLLIVAGISMGFISFFLNEHDIESGTLIYIAQCFVAGGSFMGIAVYLDKHIQEAIDILKGHTEEHHLENDKSDSEK